ncbi:DNA polymerase IV [Weissella viridescens]|uniref:DNA polymerase IV n=1 Tax=Weissella viridescens TaxID=1629 RepID=A0A3P2RI43_WEIVI|nr:DNA polymerase IV [Weissella viridescens]RRG17382.1 DNA polymerase IV [Weissella viridescens]
MCAWLQFPLKIDTSRKILHIDMDAFYAQIEIRDNPALQDEQVILARDPRKTGGTGVVATANYHARKLGVHSAMSAAEALEKAPDAVFVTPNFEKYKQVSEQVHEIFHQYTDKIEPVAFDEAYLDLSDHTEPLITIAHQLQQKIFDKLSLTSSVGISFNKFLAKLASEHNKPAGLTVIRSADIRPFLDSQPIEAIRGVGSKTVERMHELEIENGRDLYELSQDKLIDEFGKQGFELYQRIRGIDDRPVQYERQRKSIGKEHTFNPPIRSEQETLDELRSLAKEVVQSLKNKKMHGKTLVLKLRDEEFNTTTHRATFNDFIENDPNIIYNLGLDILEEIGGYTTPLRLVGLTITGLTPISFENITLSLYES